MILAVIILTMSTPETNPDAEPVVAPDANQPALLSDEDTQLLTEARTSSWRLQHHEYAYDYTVRKLSSMQTLFDFLGILLAIVFIYLQVAVPDSKVNVEYVLGLIGTGLSLILILVTVWASMAQWKSRIERMQNLSTTAHNLLKQYEKIVVVRPVDHAKIRKWQLDVIDFDEERKDPLSLPWSLGMVRGFQHMANRNHGRGVVCGICHSEWKPENNKKAKWSWLPFYGCSECGV